MTDDERLRMIHQLDQTQAEIEGRVGRTLDGLMSDLMAGAAAKIRSIQEETKMRDSTEDLAAFIRVRLAETEQLAEQARFGTDGKWYDPAELGDVLVRATDAPPSIRKDAALFAHMTPARVLADVAATRAILRMLRLNAKNTADDSIEREMYLEGLKQIAAAYADYPDYRETEWALTSAASAQ